MARKMLTIQQKRDAKNAYMRQYREDNKDSLNARGRERYRDDLENNRSKNRQKYANNAEHIKEKSKERYHNDPKRAYEISRKSIKKRIKLIRDMLVGKECQDCGFNVIHALDYHHRNPDEKVATVCYMVNRNFPYDAILSEIAKCDILCGNCHGKRTAGDIGYGNAQTGRTRRWLADYKSTLTCANCPENFAYCLHFHHRDPATKVECVSKMTNTPNRYSIEDILKEIDKCDVLCVNCHRITHAQERQGDDE